MPVTYLWFMVMSMIQLWLVPLNLMVQPGIPSTMMAVMITSLHHSVDQPSIQRLKYGLVVIQQHILRIMMMLVVLSQKLILVNYLLVITGLRSLGMAQVQASIR